MQKFNRSKATSRKQGRALQSGRIDVRETGLAGFHAARLFLNQFFEPAVVLPQENRVIQRRSEVLGSGYCDLFAFSDELGA